ncbi:MAG: sulfatase-like hydrolase/transferase, partial [Planctomycetota bacterium]
MPEPDILIVLSDQHSAACAGFAGNDVVRTPNLDRLAEEGTVFDAAYTSCPLCVPARSAFLTGQLPSSTGVYRNQQMIPCNVTTFLHSLGAAGYETVLCGRMHFKGVDQRHGFTRRIFGDVTHTYKSGVGDFGPFSGALGMGGCMDLVGAGDSPILEYDRQVVRAAVNYLEQDHERPQCIVVGTYGPHFTYCCSPDLFDEYWPQVEVPPTFFPENDPDHPVKESKAQRQRTNMVTGEEEDVNEHLARAARAAYYGMITELDGHVGTMRKAWERYLDRSGREGVFMYTSDHGDTVGEHGVFGKQTFYEGSARIPMIVAGDGVAAGQSVQAPVSIVDIAPTLRDLTGVQQLPHTDGLSLCSVLRGESPAQDRTVLSEYMEGWGKNIHAGRMVRQNQWKLIHYEQCQEKDLLFDVANDPQERRDLSTEKPNILQQLRDRAQSGWEVDRLVDDFR